ncbi:MAG: universal stress protein [Chlamydiae bacterium]|nr:universal stress protein [Chlamydiota bacterium]
MGFYMAKSPSKITEMASGTMKQVLTLSDVFAVGYGDLGSSIYYALGITALYALGATPIALIIAGFVFACTALTYAEMSSMHLAAGGSTSFTRYAINDLVSFIAGWALLLDFIVTIAISSYSAIPYLSYFFPLLKEPLFKILLSICLIGILLTLNIFGAKHSTRLSWILTSLTILTQVIIITIGAFCLLHLGELFAHLKIGKNTLWSPSWADFWKGTAMAMVAYTGIESMAQLTSETKRPAKTVPRAILIATVLLILMYVGISSVALSAVTPEVLSTTFLEDPVSGIVSALPFGKTILGPWVSLLGAIILIVAANAGLIGASRVAFRMGEYHQLPRFLYNLHPHFKTPVVSLSVFAVLAALIIVWSRGHLDFLADIYNFGAMLAFFSAHISLIFLRCNKPDQERPFKIPFGIRLGKCHIPISALIGAFATFCVWLSVVILKPEGRYLGILWIAFGLTMYLIYRKQAKIAPVPTLEIEKIQMPEYKKLTFQHLLVPIRSNQQTETLQLACQMAKIYGADITALHIIEVPFSISINTPLYYKMKQAEQSMKRAEAVARDYGLSIHLQTIRARSTAKAILDFATDGNFDLLIMGAAPVQERGFLGGLSSITEEVMKKSPCQVMIACVQRKHH